MSDTFFAYLHRLELMAFFSGYPLIYAIVFFIAGNRPLKNKLKGRLFFLLPLSYALVGTLYLGLQLKNLYPDYSFRNIALTMEDPILIIWGLLSLLFWIPVFHRKPFLSLLHSLVFFFFLIKDLFQRTFYQVDKTIVRNDMNIYTNSLLINMAAFAFIVLLSLLFTRAGKVK
ncbi:MAG: hypothetical protein ACXWWC_01805 [Chitinophagaceae bacterium]